MSSRTARGRTRRRPRRPSVPSDAEGPSLAEPPPRGHPPGDWWLVRRRREREELTEAATQGLAIEQRLHVPLDGQRDPPTLLGDDEDDRVGLLSEAERGTVAGPHGPAQLGIARQGEEAARCGDSIPADEHRSVVEGRVGQEEALEEIARHDGIQVYAELRVVAKSRHALQDQQSADALAREGVSGLDDVVDQTPLLLPHTDGDALEEPALSEPCEGTAQLGLEEDHEGEDPERPEVLEEIAGAEQLEATGGERHHQQAPEAQEHLDPPRLLEHHEDAVEYDGDEQDIDGVVDPERPEGRPHRHGGDPLPDAVWARIASATRTACTVSPTSCVRITWAPASTAAVVAAREP